MKASTTKIDATSEDAEIDIDAVMHRVMPKPPAITGRFGRAIDIMGAVVATFFLISTAIVLSITYVIAGFNACDIVPAY